MKRSVVECISYLKPSNGNVLPLSSLFKRTVTTKKNKETPHSYYRWGYKQLPTQTILDERNPHFAVRPPDFKLPKANSRLSRKDWRKRIAELQECRNDPVLEKLARERKLMISLEEVDAEWRKEYGLTDLNNLSKFYGINRDLYHGNDIIMKTWLNVMFDDVKIHRGNIIEPRHLLNVPTVSFDLDNDDCLHTLILSNVDGHPLDSNKELVHWLVCNIKKGDVRTGDQVVSYLPPIPWKGTGYHRLVFSLYEQTKEINIENYKTDQSSTIKARSFSSPSFQDSSHCFPVSLAWCQLQWDESVGQTCQLLEDLKEEPVFDWEEYIEPKEEQKLLKIQLSELRYRNM